MAGVEPSILLHPLDFLGADDVDALDFFPGMGLSGARKRERVGAMIDLFLARFDVMPLGTHVARLISTSPPVISGELSAPEATTSVVLARLQDGWRRSRAGAHGWGGRFDHVRRRTND